jgi:hypothetical protein
MLNFDNTPYIYLCLHINGNTLGVKIVLFGIIYVSLSSKARQSNTQNHCISPLMLENIFHLSGNTSAAANVLLQEAHPSLHSVLGKFKIKLCLWTGCSCGKTYTSCSGYVFVIWYRCGRWQGYNGPNNLRGG